MMITGQEESINEGSKEGEVRHSCILEGSGRGWEDVAPEVPYGHESATDKSWFKVAS